VLELIIRKLLVAIATCTIGFLTYSLWGGLDFSLFALMYLIPIIILFGVPVSVFSDYAIKRFEGFKRVFLALFIHQFFAALFFLIPTLTGQKWDIMYMGIQDVFMNFFFISAILTSSLFWILDEILRIKLFQGKCRQVLKKIGDYY